jgi:hypothetical protein
METKKAMIDKDADYTDKTRLLDKETKFYQSNPYTSKLFINKKSDSTTKPQYSAIGDLSTINRLSSLGTSILSK